MHPYDFPNVVPSLLNVFRSFTHAYGNFYEVEAGCVPDICMLIPKQGQHCIEFL